MLGSRDGILDGNRLVVREGSFEGCNDGDTEGCKDGNADNADDPTLGIFVGFSVDAPRMACWIDYCLAPSLA